VAGALHDVIYAPVDTQHYGAGVQFPRARKHSVVSIGLIANWNPIKGIEYFVRAAAVVRERLAGKLEVVFAGARMANHPDYCQRVDALIDELGIRSAIRDYGFVLSVAPILADLDVLVLSSTTEACPMVILEGMAAGVPVVATDVGGVRELLLGEPERPAGIVVPPKDPAALAEAVLELLRHPEKAARMGQNGRQLAEERFSLSICAQRHLRVYERASKR
jgi:glycosyltransferase involved in cell wall biosynthesis